MSLMSEENKSNTFHVPKVLYENRYCNQEGFSILVCGGKDKNGKVTNEVLELKIPSFDLIKFPSTVKPHYEFELLNFNSGVFARCDTLELNQKLGKSKVSVETYSEKNESWTHQYIQVEENHYYCITSFMNKLFTIGGWIFDENDDKGGFSMCFVYNFKRDKWSKIANLNIARQNFAF